MVGHGMTDTKFHRAWTSLARKCHNPKAINYSIYGGRGITFCARWRSFLKFKEDMYASFLEHVKVHGEKNTTLERIDNNGNYTPTNCRWATMTEQARNRRTNRLLTHNGVTQSLAQWADDYGLTYVQLKLRLRRGWTMGDALTKKRLTNQYG
jgi:hypothetical protein